MRKNRDRSKLYMCVGENFKDNFPIGDCGDIRSLIDWCCHLWPRRTREELETFFDDSYTNKDVVDYIYRSGGKRLKEVT